MSTTNSILCSEVSKALWVPPSVPSISRGSAGIPTSSSSLTISTLQPSIAPPPFSMGTSPSVGPLSFPTIQLFQPLSSSELEFLQQETLGNNTVQNIQQRSQSPEIFRPQEIGDELDWSALEKAWPAFDPSETLHPQEIGDGPDLSALEAWLVPDKEFFVETPQWSQVFEDESSNTATGDQQTQEQAAAKTLPVKSKIHPLSQKNLDAQTTHHLDGRRPKMQLGTAEARYCSSCGTIETSRWHKDPQDKSKDRCNACYQRAKPQPHPLVGKTCSSCRSIETPQWYKNPLDKSKDYCQSCYRKAKAYQASLAGKTCSSCGTAETPQWCKDPQDKSKDHCLVCYRKAKAYLKFCSSCGTTSGSHWYKDPQDKSKDRCNNCYQKAKAHLDSLSGKSCSSCGTTSTSRWYKDSQDKSKDHCIACYQIAKKQLDSLDDRSCSSCGTTETSRWCKDQQDRSRDHCLACYRKAQKSLDKDRKRLAEEELEQRSAPALPPMLQYSPLHPSCPR